MTAVAGSGRIRKPCAARRRPDLRYRNVAQAIVNLAAERTIAFVAKRSRRPTPAHKRSPSEAIAPT
jgi:hypothetical protein